MSDEKPPVTWGDRIWVAGVLLMIVGLMWLIVQLTSPR